MKIAIVGKKYGFLEKHIGELDAKYPKSEMHLFILDKSDANVPINPKLKELKPDLLITENLVRFDESTLTDSISYNLLNCRQIHLLTDKDISAAEKYMTKQLSLSMHFFCMDEEYKLRLLEMNRDIPFIEVLPNDWTDVVRIVYGE